MQALRGRVEGCQGSGCAAPHQDRDRSSGRKIQCCRLLAACKTAVVFPFKLCQAVLPRGGCSALLRRLNFAIDKSASARKRRKAGVCLPGGKKNNNKKNGAFLIKVPLLNISCSLWDCSSCLKYVFNFGCTGQKLLVYNFSALLLWMFNIRN